MRSTGITFSVLLVLLLQAPRQSSARISPLSMARAAGLWQDVHGKKSVSVQRPLQVIPRAVVEEAYSDLAKKLNKKVVTDTKNFRHPVVEDIIFQLYTNKNPDEYQRLVAADPDSLKKSDFNRRRQTVVIVHGFLENVKDSAWLIDMKASFLKKNSNVILVDWGVIADGSLASYFRVVQHVPFVGEHLAELFKAMKKQCGLSEKKLYLIGFSLGAHVSGFAGKHFANIARITGLDPAGPAYELAGDNDRLCTSDANFVDVIHTDMELFGHSGKLGHVDFYMNGGKDQNCGQLCNHGTSHDYYNSSILNRPVKGYQCDNESAFEAAECLGQPTNYFGFFSEPATPGNFYVMTIRPNMTSSGRLARLTQATVHLPDEDVRGAFISFKLEADTYAENGFNFSDFRTMRVGEGKEQSILLLSPLDLSLDDVSIEMWSGKYRTDKSRPMVLPSVSFKDLESGKKTYACNVHLESGQPQLLNTSKSPCSRDSAPTPTMNTCH